MKSTNKGADTPAESVGAKDRARGESGRPKHAPDTGLGKACHRRPSGYGNLYNGNQGNVSRRFFTT